MSRGTFTSLSLHLGDDADIRCFTYPDKPGRGPILNLDGPGITLTISNAGLGGATAQDVTNAHALAEAVAVYVAEIERLHAETHTDPAELTPETPETLESSECSSKPGAAEAA